MITSEGPDGMTIVMTFVRWVLGTQDVPVLDSAARVCGFIIVGYLLARIVRWDVTRWRSRRRRPGPPASGPGRTEPGG